MKTRFVLCSAFAASLAFGLFLCGCNKPSQPSPPPQAAAPEASKALKSAEPTSFQEVTAQLDPGGNFYLYLSTEQWLDGMSAKVAQWRQLADSLPNVQDSDRQNIARAFDVVTNLIKDSGLEDVSGFGVSSIARERGLYHTKAIVHHYKGKGSGFAWSLLGQKPHALDGLGLLPANTAFAAFSDLDVAMFWSVVEKEVGRSDFPQAQQILKQLPDQFEKATRLKWDQVLASLGGEFGCVLTLDGSRMVTLPIPNQNGPLEIPEPALMLVAKVKDDTVFNRIDEALKTTGQNIVSNDKPGLKMRTVPVPLPLPIQFRPTVAVSGGYLFIATTDALIQEALAVKAGQKPGLKSTDEFRRLAADVPEQGNQFSFLSQRLGQAMTQLQRQALQMAPNAAQTEWLQSLLTSSNGACSYAVGMNTDEGYLSVGNGNQHPTRMLLVGAAVPVGMLSAIAIPNFVKARATAQKNACINNLRQLDGAAQQWALENKKGETAVPTRSDLLPFLHNRQFPVCPAGGQYTLNKVSAVPECSYAGHSLPK